MIFNNVVHYNSSDVANKFKEHFISSIKDIRESIEDVQYDNQIKVISNRFIFRKITISKLKTICNTIKEKPDYNKENICLILDYWHLYEDIMLSIINS